jgi:hypothetical protein
VSPSQVQNINMDMNYPIALLSSMPWADRRTAKFRPPDATHRRPLGHACNQIAGDSSNQHRREIYSKFTRSGNNTLILALLRRLDKMMDHLAARRSHARRRSWGIPLCWSIRAYCTALSFFRPTEYADHAFLLHSEESTLDSDKCQASRAADQAKHGRQCSKLREYRE